MSVYGQFLFENTPRHAEIEGDTAFFIHDLFTDRSRTGESALIADLTILPPVTPSKLFAIGINYAAHAAEHGNDVPPQPLMWFKAPSSLLAHGGDIELVYPEHRNDCEAELAIVIGKRGKKISADEADNFILGYAPAQDISDRVIQRSESQWARAKSMDTYSPFGPYISTDIDASALSIQSILNGEVKQNGNTRDMINSPARIVEFVSQTITLEPGDVIFTGTPEGVSPLSDGDVLETRIEGMAPLINHVRLAS